MMKNILFILALSLFYSCVNDSVNPKIETISSNKLKEQTVPIAIENYTGSLTVQGNLNYQNDSLLGSDFLISLAVNHYTLEKKLTTDTILSSIKDDSTKNQLLGASIYDISYEGIRANTLYFSSTLLNNNSKKEVKGRFALFYTTNKKGVVYGWLTDDVINKK